MRAECGAEARVSLPERILLGVVLAPEKEIYRRHNRFLETFDEKFAYSTHSSRQGRWWIDGVDLPEDGLRKGYR